MRYVYRCPLPVVASFGVTSCAPPPAARHAFAVDAIVFSATTLLSCCLLVCCVSSRALRGVFVAVLMLTIVYKPVLSLDACLRKQDVYDSIYARAKLGRLLAEANVVRCVCPCRVVQTGHLPMYDSQRVEGGGLCKLQEVTLPPLCFFFLGRDLIPIQ